MAEIDIGELYDLIQTVNDPGNVILDSYKMADNTKALEIAVDIFDRLPREEFIQKYSQPDYVWQALHVFAILREYKNSGKIYPLYEWWTI